MECELKTYAYHLKHCCDTRARFSQSPDGDIESLEKLPGRTLITARLVFIRSQFLLSTSRGTSFHDFKAELVDENSTELHVQRLHVSQLDHAIPGSHAAFLKTL